MSVTCFDRCFVVFSAAHLHSPLSSCFHFIIRSSKHTTTVRMNDDNGSRCEDTHENPDLLAKSERTKSLGKSTWTPGVDDHDSVQALSRRIDGLQKRMVRVQRGQMQQTIALHNLHAAIFGRIPTNFLQSPMLQDTNPGVSACESTTSRNSTLARNPRDEMLAVIKGEQLIQYRRV